MKTTSGDSGRYQETGRESEDGKRETGGSTDADRLAREAGRVRGKEGRPDKYGDKRQDGADDMELTLH